MSRVNAILSGGERVLLATGHGDNFTVASGAAINQKFCAELDSEEAFDPDMPLGSDRRMRSVIRIFQDRYPEVVAKLKKHDYIQCGNQRYEVLDRDNNPATITVDYEVVLVV